MSYLYLPLCSLAAYPSIKERMTKMLHYCIVYSGLRYAEKHTDEELRGLAMKNPLAEEGWFSEEDQLHRVVAAGAEIVFEQPDSYEQALLDHEEMERYLTVFEANHKRMRFRISTDLFRRTRLGVMPYEDFSVLCGLFAGMASYPVARDLFEITHETIGYRAMGYQNLRVLRKEVKRRTDGRLEPISVGEVGALIEKYRHREWFWLTDGKDGGFYFGDANKMTEEEFRRAVSTRLSLPPMLRRGFKSPPCSLPRT